MLSNDQTCDKYVSRMKDYAASVVSDEALAGASQRWPDGTPETKEAYYLREVFDSKVSSLDTTFLC